MSGKFNERGGGSEERSNGLAVSGMDSLGDLEQQQSSSRLPLCLPTHHRCHRSPCSPCPVLRYAPLPVHPSTTPTTAQGHHRNTQWWRGGE